MIENIILEQLTPEEIADSFVLPHGLRKSEKQAADAELRKELSKKRALTSESQKLESNILQFKFQLED